MRILKCISLSLSTAALCFAFAGHATTLTIDIVSQSAATPAKIVFTGSTKTISFQDASDGYDFVIAASSDASLIGKKGNIGGTFTINAINAGPPQNATVTSTGGTFSIFDGSNTLTADLDLKDVATFGSIVGLNFNAQANLSNLSYVGGNAGLLSLLGSPDATITLSSQFVPPKSLTALTKTGAVNASTYSGSMAATVPEPSSYLLLAAGLAAAAVSLRRRSLA